MSELLKCTNCGASFTRKASLVYHQEHVSCREKSHSCKICNKQFTSESSMYRHMRSSCTVKKKQDEEKEDILERLVKLEDNNKKLELENVELKNEVKVLKKTVTTTTKTIKNINKKTIGTLNNNTNNGVIINGNVTLVGYGQEDLSKLNKTELLKILQQGYHSTIKLTEVVHFNPRYPEYHNIFISNMKDKYAMMFDGKNWTLTTKEDLINKIYDDKKNYIEENLDEFVDSLQPSRKKALERWLETDDDDDKIKEIKENIKILLYNHRKMVDVNTSKQLCSYQNNTEQDSENMKSKPTTVKQKGTLPEKTTKIKKASRSVKILKDG